jgi:plastocyanin
MPSRTQCWTWYPRTVVAGASTVSFVVVGHTKRLITWRARPYTSATTGSKARQSTPLADNEVGIDNFSFTPPNRTVAVGTTVTWINRDDVPHRIGSADQKFPLGPAIDTDQHFAYTFTTPGRYPYFCTVHPTMTGVITVTPG